MNRQQQRGLLDCHPKGTAAVVALRGSPLSKCRASRHWGAPDDHVAEVLLDTTCATMVGKEG